METIVILLAAGRGSRFGSDGNKVFQAIDGITILERSVRCLLSHPAVSSMIVVSAPGEEDRMGSLLAGSFPGREFRIVTGGETRQRSAFLGLLAARRLADEGGSPRNHALIHDAARCFLPAKIVTALLGTISRHHCGAAPAVSVTDTIRLLDESGNCIEKTLPRGRLVAMQTPQGADLDVLLRAAELADKEKIEVTDDLELLIRIGFPVRLVRGDPRNIKITTQEDLFFAMSHCLP